MSKRPQTPTSTLIQAGDVDKRIMYIKEDTQLETSKPVHDKEPATLTLRRPKGRSNTELIRLDSEEIAAIAAMWYDNHNLPRPKALTPPSMEERYAIANVSSKIRDIIEGLNATQKSAKGLKNQEDVKRIFTNHLEDLPEKYGKIQRTIDSILGEDQVTPSALYDAVKALKQEVANWYPSRELDRHLQKNDHMLSDLNRTVHQFESLYTRLNAYIKMIDDRFDDETKKEAG